MKKEYFELPKVGLACARHPITAWEGLTQWDVPTTVDFDTKQARVILAMEMGQGDVTPALSNCMIANVAATLRSKLDIPICAQDEAAHCLRDLGTPADMEVIKEGDYIDSQEVVQAYARWCLRPTRRRRLHPSLVVSHRFHQWRIVRAATKLGLIAFPADCSTVPCDPDSTQSWTTSENVFKRYELQARMFFLGRDWI